MLRFRTFNFLWLIPLSGLFFSARVFAQFEVAPDHFDSNQTEPARSTDTNKKFKAAARDGMEAIEPASMHERPLNQRIAEQEAVLAEYRARIRAKAEQLEAALQSLLRTGNEAGEAEAVVIYQRELNKLQKALAPEIHSTEATLARLQAEAATKSQLRTSPPAKHRTL
jgi:septal ring factor EnvC (AmiA/AmiB activator)